MNELLIRPMEELDLSQAAAIEKEAITPPWSEQAFRESLGLEHTILLAAIEDGQVAGYCVCYQSFEEGEITNVAVKKELRGQGIAGKLLEKLCSYGRERGWSAISWRCAPAMNRPFICMNGAALPGWESGRAFMSSRWRTP